MGIHLLLLLIALLLFVCAALGVASGRVNLTAAGLAFLAASMLLLGGCNSEEPVDRNAIVVNNDAMNTDVDECPRADGQPCR